ncbi:MAG: glycosyltransferase family 1 protein [Planctomycetota bacterium]
MIRVALLDTTEAGSRGSMTRYRLQLERALAEYASDTVRFESVHLGRRHEARRRVPAKFHTYARHFRCWRDARKFDAASFDILHLLDGSFGYVASAVDASRTVVTVHDIIPRLQVEGRFPAAPGISRPSRWLIQRSLRGVSRAEVVCSVSDNTKQDLVRIGCRTPNDTRVVPMAIEPDLFSVEECQDHGGSSTPSLFHLGNNGFYKNRCGAVEVFRRIQSESDLSLVLAGPPPDEALRELVQQHDLQNRVRFENDPDQETLGRLYRESSVFVFPSLYEGFGWPPLEAMSVGCPVVCSDAGSIPEVVGDAAIVEASEDYDAMARGCERLLSEASFREQMIKRGFERVREHSLERLATQMVSIYRDAAA